MFRFYLTVVAPDKEVGMAYVEDLPFSSRYIRLKVDSDVNETSIIIHSDRVPNSARSTDVIDKIAGDSNISSSIIRIE